MMAGGFGSPDGSGDLGFGDVVAVGAVPLVEDWGFGDVPPLDFLLLTVLGDKDREVAVWPDSGGEIVRLVGNWPLRGPYRVQLVDAFSGAVYPDASEGYVTAPVVVDALGIAVGREDRHALFTEDGNRRQVGIRLPFILPPCPASVYHIDLKWPTGALRIEDAIRVVHRGRALEVWRVRAAWPELHDVGARDPRAEVILEGGG